MLTPDQAQRAFNRDLPLPGAEIPDHVLVNTMCRYGFDRSETFTQFKFSLPGQYRWLRDLALKFYADVLAAGRGDADAKERIDYMSEVWRERLRHRLDHGERGDQFTADERAILRKMGLKYS